MFQEEWLNSLLEKRFTRHEERAAGGKVLFLDGAECFFVGKARVLGLLLFSGLVGQRTGKRAAVGGNLGTHI